MRFLALRRSITFALSLFALGAAAAACGDSGTETTSTTSTGTGAGNQGGGGGSTVEGTPLKIVNWNIKNFFNDSNDSPAPDETVKSTSEYQAQLAAAAAILEELDADIAILQEIEGVDVLDDLNSLMGNKYPERVVVEGNDPRGVDIAGLSKTSFANVVSHKDDVFNVEGTNAPDYTFARDCVEFHTSFQGQDIVLLGVHYRSKGPPDDPNKRLAEAQRTRAIADSLTAADPSLGVIILGDFNDLPNSIPFQAVAGSEPDLYVDAASFVPEAERWTFDFMGAKELIDHQMANPVLSARLDTSSVLIRKGTDVGTASDHFPMSATYRFE